MTKNFDGKDYHGRVAEVKPDDRYPVTVKFDDGDVETCTFAQFDAEFGGFVRGRAATRSSATRSSDSPPLPEVGDRIRKKFGKTWYSGKVLEATPGDRYPIAVKFDDGYVETCTAHQFHAKFETADDTSEGPGTPLPEVGDRVRKKFDGEWFEGTVETVVKGDRWPISVRYDDGDAESLTCWTFHSQCEPLALGVQRKKRKVSAAEKEKEKEKEKAKKRKTAPASDKKKNKNKKPPPTTTTKTTPAKGDLVSVECYSPSDDKRVARLYPAHGYAPKKINLEMKIPFKRHLKCLWEVVYDVWTRLCDEVNVPANEPARKHLYLPGKIMIYSEPKLWDELVGPDKEVKEIHDFRFNRNQTIAAALDFAGGFLSQTLDLNGGFQGEDHVRRKCDFPKSWSESKRDKYAEAFDAITRKINDVREDGAAWSLCPHLGDKRTCVVVQTIDRVGGFAR